MCRMSLLLLLLLLLGFYVFFLHDTYSGAYATRHTLTLQSELCGHLHFQIGHDRVQRQSPRPRPNCLHSTAVCSSSLPNSFLSFNYTHENAVWPIYLHAVIPLYHVKKYKYRDIMYNTQNWHEQVPNLRYQHFNLITFNSQRLRFH